MRSYSVRDVERVLQLAPDTTRSLIRAGFVHPARGPRREYRFSFQDLIVLRTARALLDARIPKKRIRRSLESLRRNLPESMPLSGLAISAVGDHVVVRDGDARWQVDSGQYLLGLDVSLQDGVLHVVEHKQAAPAVPAPPDDWFAQALNLESSDPDGALTAYRRAVDQLGTPAARARPDGRSRCGVSAGAGADRSGPAAAVQPGRVARGSGEVRGRARGVPDGTRRGPRSGGLSLQPRPAL